MANGEHPLVERVAKALFQQALNRARLQAGDLKFDLSDAIPVFKKLVKETDTGIAIISAAYIDECLKALLGLHVDTSSRQIFNKIFDFSGPLGTFSSRIDLAFGFNFISKQTHQRINSIKNIRNEFAHNPFGVSFNTTEIKDKILSIDLDHKRFIDEIRKGEDIRRVTKQPSRMTMKETFLTKSALSLGFMASEIIAFPIAKQNQVPASAILADYDNLPDNLKEIRRNTAECVLETFRMHKK